MGNEVQELITKLPSVLRARVFVEDTGHETPCLTWTRSKTTAGYGNLKLNGKNVYAHRLAYEAQYGAIPRRMDNDRAVIDHLCRNRACVNVDHMEVVTNRINILRGDTVQAAHALRTHCVNGHEFTPENTYRVGAYGRGCRTCKRERDRKEGKQRKPRKQRKRARKEGQRKPRERKTHCKRGHEFTEENTYMKPGTGKRECRTCLKTNRQERTRREREQRGPAVDRKKTHCKWGHEFNSENTFYNPNGSRRCRQCMREHNRRSKERRRWRK